MDSWLNMVLLCGLLLIASLQTTNAFRYRRSTSEKTQTMKTYIHHLQKNYNLFGTEWVSKSVFASYLEKSKAPFTCQALLLERMLNTYENIFKDMMNSAKNSENSEKKVENLKYVMKELQKLRQNYSREQTVWRELQDINSVKVNNTATQGGALNDFLMVFDQAYKEKHPNKLP
ncbi:interferon gamma related isoform X2 [Pseudorasbora parva]|uniref:interferon gamma related isoform X2 n=1 Tax=Pseudorasbora parva TaxID=51549 RepID=UPI00351EA746